jgi:cytochrome b involved in lipid metabolism
MYAGTITNYLSTPVGIMVLLAAFVIFYFLFLRNDSKPQEEIGKVVLKEISRKEVEKHNKLTDLWFVVDNQVYDVTKFVPMHPGGDKIGKPAGGDATLNFWKPHHPSRAYESLMELRIGYVPKEEKILREISKEDVKRHGNRNNAWIAINGFVYDITTFVDNHPGGLVILSKVGEDSTKEFQAVGHPQSVIDNEMPKYLIGKLKVE